MPAKSKKDEPCYTKTSKSGKTYVTCEGAQKREKKFAKEISSLGKTSDKLQAAKKAKAKAPVKATEKQKELMRKRREAAKAKKAKATDPNSIGQKNIQALFKLGDLAPQISKEAKSQGTYLAPIHNLLVFADGDKMKEKIRNVMKGNNGLENYGLAGYEVKAGDTIANIRLISPTDLSKFWLPDGEKMDKGDLEDGIKIKGFMTGKRYKHLKSWSVNKGIPMFSYDWPSWWDAGRREISEKRQKKRNEELNERREKAVKLTVPQMRNFIEDNFYSKPFLSKMKKADLIKEIKTNNSWK